MAAVSRSPTWGSTGASSGRSFLSSPPARPGARYPVPLLGPLGDDRNDAAELREMRHPMGPHVSVVAVGRLGPARRPPINHTTPTVPLIDMSTRYSYKGLEGGLFPGGRNTPPAAHLAEGLAAAALIEPLDANGDPDAGGKIGVLMTGMSNAAQEACYADAGVRTVSGVVPGDCRAGSWIDRWWNDPAADKSHVVVLNGAEWGKVIDDWDSPSDAQWTDVLNDVLTPGGLTEAQVQVVVVKNVVGSGAAIPDGSSRAVQERAGLALVIAAAKTRYPNLRQVFVMSRVRAGNSSPTGHPSIEPYAYESGFACKWVVEDYINGVLPADPFVTWGPYLWANGSTPRGDGTTWILTDPGDIYPSDQVHMTDAGISKAGNLMHNWFMVSPFTPWYRA